MDDPRIRWAEQNMKDHVKQQAKTSVPFFHIQPCFWATWVGGRWGEGSGYASVSWLKNGPLSDFAGPRNRVLSESPERCVSNIGLVSMFSVVECVCRVSFMLSIFC